MESHNDPVLKSIVNVIIAVSIIIAAVLFALPYLIKNFHENRLERLKAKDFLPPEVLQIQAKVTPLIDQLSLGELLAEHQSLDSYFAVYQNGDPITTAEQLQSLLIEEGIESYLSVLDGFDAAIRVYAGATLTHHLLFSPPTPPLVEGFPKKVLREQPQIAIIIGKMGKRDMNQVTQHTLPMSIGICPYQAFSMRIAEKAAQHYHEVLSDLRCDYSDNHTGVMAIPYTTGLIHNQNQNHNLSIPNPIFVKPADGNSPPSNNDMVVNAQFAPHRSAMDSLARALSISREKGVGALLINADDPELDSVLTWSLGASELGYRLVLASELGRYQSLIGPMASTKD